MNRETNAGGNTKKNIADMLRERYPDRRFDTDDDHIDAFNVMATGYDELKKYKDESEENSQVIADAMEDDEVLAMVLNDIHNGIDFKRAIAKHMSPEDLIVLKEDENYPSYEESIKEREKRLEKKRGREADVQNAMKMLDEFANENFADDPEGREDFYGLLKMFAMGNFTKDQLAMLNRGRNYDKDISAAKEISEMRGRNTNIAESKKTPQGDGLANFSSGATEQNRGSSIEDIDITNLKNYVKDKKKSQI